MIHFSLNIDQMNAATARALLVDLESMIAKIESSGVATAPKIEMPAVEETEKKTEPKAEPKKRGRKTKAETKPEPVENEDDDFSGDEPVPKSDVFDTSEYDTMDKDELIALAKRRLPTFAKEHSRERVMEIFQEYGVKGYSSMDDAMLRQFLARLDNEAN